MGVPVIGTNGGPVEGPRGITGEVVAPDGAPPGTIAVAVAKLAAVWLAMTWFNTVLTEGMLP